jgi:hypothetical protein
MNSRRQILLTRLVVVLDIIELSYITLVISTLLFTIKRIDISYLILIQLFLLQIVKNKKTIVSLIY